MRILLALVLSFTTFAQSPTVSSPELLHKTFDAVWNTINKKYYDPKFGGVDWNAVKKKYEPQIEALKSDAEFRDLLTRMLRELKTSHLNIINLETLSQSLTPTELTPGLAIRDLNNQPVVTRVMDASPAAAVGVRPGFVVKAVDGVAVTTSGGAERAIGAKLTSHRVTFLAEGDVSREIELPYKLPSEDQLVSSAILSTKENVLLEAKTLEGNIGYIHFTAFIPALEKRFGPIFASMHDTAGIVIDLRGNGGGWTDTGVVLASMFVEKETLIAATQTRKGRHEYKAKPVKNPYRGKIVFLLDERSSSESEELAAGLQAVARIFVIGTKTHGSDMDAEIVRLPIKTMALMYPAGFPRTSKGSAIEGVGVTPDIQVQLTRADLLQGHDAQLEAAIRHIQGR